jgi:hypothetical protein
MVLAQQLTVFCKLVLGLRGVFKEILTHFKVMHALEQMG